MNSNFDYSVIDRILEEIGNKPKNTIALLQAIQEHYNYLPAEIFPYLAKKIGSSEANPSEGTLSVITSAKRYASQLHVFDSDYKEEIFT